jgi:hypothetical protein
MVDGHKGSGAGRPRILLGQAGKTIHVSVVGPRIRMMLSSSRTAHGRAQRRNHTHPGKSILASERKPCARDSSSIGFGRSIILKHTSTFTAESHPKRAVTGLDGRRHELEQCLWGDLDDLLLHGKRCPER